MEKKISLVIHGNQYQFLSGNSGKAVCTLWFPRFSRNYRRQPQMQVTTLEISGGREFRKQEPWGTQKHIGGKVSVPSSGRWALGMAGRSFPPVHHYPINTPWSWFCYRIACKTKTLDIWLPCLFSLFNIELVHHLGSLNILFLSEDIFITVPSIGLRQKTRAPSFSQTFLWPWRHDFPHA